MPNSSRPSSHRPTFVPAFQENSSGVVANNSAQSGMIMGMQKLILEQGDGKKRANEEAHMGRRQDIVDRYTKANGGTDKIRTEKFVAKLPTVASPQPVIINLHHNSPIADARSRQERAFAGSFLAKEKSNLSFVYNEIDDAMAEVNRRKIGISFMEKRTWSKEKRINFFYEPLREAVQYLDNHFNKNDEPLRIKWREVQDAPGKLRIDLFFVYPNLKAQYEHGFNTWMGAGDVTEF